MKNFLIAIFLTLGLAACGTSQVGDVTPQDTSPLTKMADGIDELAQNDLFKVAEADADATLKWLATSDKAPKDELVLEQAKLCPKFVKLAVKDFREKSAAWSTDLRARAGEVDTAEGPQLILRLTRLKYGERADVLGKVAEIKTHVFNRVNAVVTGCRGILPGRVLGSVAGIVTKAGIATSVPGLGGGVPVLRLLRN